MRGPQPFSVVYIEIPQIEDLSIWMRRFNSLVRSSKIFKKGVEICSVRRTVAEAQDYCSRRKKDFKPQNIEVRRFEILEKCYRLSLIHISEPTRLLSISYAVFCLKKKKKKSIPTK